MYLNTLDKKECCGCTACLHICPKQCISMKQDDEGFLYPVIDKNICINCGLCEKVCPVTTPVYKNKKGDVYAAYVKDISQRMQSTSGGIFYVVAEWVIKQGGIVYGAAFDVNFKLRHIGVDVMQDLNKLRGSKYLQSDLGNVFSEIKTYLQQGRWVYFTGVGCQVAGLNAFLRKEYDTLITSDLVCHGVPSQLMFDWYMDYLRKKEKGNIVSYSFRDCKGWGGCETYEYVSQIRGRGIKKLHGYFLSPYLYSFMWAFDYRYSCYDCKFAKVPRQGDITLADYWGVKKFFRNLDVSKGVSLILINNKKGEFVWERIKYKIELHKSCLEDAAEKNGNLIHTTKMPEIRKYCYDLIRKRGYDSVAKKEFRASNYWFIWIKECVAHTLIGSLTIKCMKSIIRRI